MLRKIISLFRKTPISTPLQNGDEIKITDLPSCRNVPRGTPNPYIGMSGEVRDFDGKRFNLFTGNSWLVGIEYKKCSFVNL